AGADVHRDATGPAPARELHLARMDAGAHVEPEPGEGIANRERAAYGSRRTVEEGEKPVACGVDLFAAEPGKLAPHEFLVPSEAPGPGVGAEFAEPGGRPDEVGEQDRGEDPVTDMRGPHTREELLDLVDDVVGLPERHVGVSFKLHKARTGNVRR